MLFGSSALFAQTDTEIPAIILRAEHSLKSDYPRAILQADSALAQFTEAIISTKALKIRASAYLYSGNYPSALADFRKMYELHLADSNELEASKAINNMGLVYKTQGRYEQAMESFFRALELRGAESGKDQTANVHINIAATYAVQEGYEKARHYYEKALEGFQLKGDSNSEHQLYLDLAGLELAAGNLTECSKLLDRAFVYWKKSPIQSELARAWYIQGNYWLERGDLASAESSYSEALEIYQRIGNRGQAAGCTLRMAEVSRKRGALSEALRRALEALEMARSIGSINIQSRTHLELSIIYSRLSDFKNALEQRISYEKFNDSLQDADVKTRISELEERYQNEQKDRKMAELLAQNRAQELGLKNQEIKVWGLFAVVCIGSVIGASLWLRSRQRLRNQKKLEEKNAQIERSLEEKEILLREVHHRVKNHLQFVSSLLNLHLRHLPKGEAFEALGEAAGRIRSLSLVHESLYRGNRFTDVRVDQYLKELIESLIHVFGLREEACEVQLKLEPFSLEIERAIPLGLIVNEWVTNAFKHGRDAQDKLALSVELKVLEKAIELQVSDRGRGFEWASKAAASSGMGLKLVEQLLEKLGAQVDTVQSSAGVSQILRMSTDTDG